MRGKDKNREEKNKRKGKGKKQYRIVTNDRREEKKEIGRAHV